MSDLEFTDYSCSRFERARRPAPRPPYIVMPAMPPLGLTHALQLRLDAYRCRRQLQRLLRLDDRILRDVGHDRAAIESAVLAHPRGNPCLALGLCGRSCVDRRRPRHQ